MSSAPETLHQTDHADHAPHESCCHLEETRVHSSEAAPALSEETSLALQTRLLAPAATGGGVDNYKVMPWGSAAVTVALGIIALLSVASAIQTAAIYGKFKSGQLPAGVGGAAPNNSTQNLPNMVGGC